MNKILNIFLLLVAFLLAASCSEDVNPDPGLAGPLYGLQKGEPGSVDELIYKTWESCGVYYLYKYDKYAFQLTNWSGFFDKWYTPVKEENMELVRKVVHTIQEGVFAGMDEDFIHRNWYVRVFLCDSLCDSWDYDQNKLVEYYLENEDMLIIPNVGEVMNNYLEKDWDKWKKKFSDLLISRLYLGATEDPTEFFDLRPKDKKGRDLEFVFAPWDEDPEGEYSPNVYTFRTMGYWKSQSSAWEDESIFVVKRQEDVGDYIYYLTDLSKEELDHTWKRFPNMLKRTKAIVPYLKNVLGLDLVNMQNGNSPEHPVPVGYYDNL